MLSLPTGPSCDFISDGMNNLAKISDILGSIALTADV